MTFDDWIKQFNDPEMAEWVAQNPILPPKEMVRACTNPVWLLRWAAATDYDEWELKQALRHAVTRFLKIHIPRAAGINRQLTQKEVEKMYAETEDSDDPVRCYLPHDSRYVGDLQLREITRPLRHALECFLLATLAMKYGALCLAVKTFGFVEKDQSIMCDDIRDALMGLHYRIEGRLERA